MVSKKTFHKNDLESNDGMLTSVWGPNLWHFLHTLSFNYPVFPTRQDKQYYKRFFDTLQYILPCRYCRENLSDNYRKTGYSVTIFKNRASLSRWVYDLHNHVNQMLNKNVNISFEEVQQLYENFRARCGLTSEENSTSLQNKAKTKIEKGCTNPITGIKSKCVLQILPVYEKKHGLEVDPRCICKRSSPAKSKSKTLKRTCQK